MLALIGTARFETLVRRLFSTKGSEAAPLLSPEIQPVIVLENDRPETDFLEGRGRFMGQTDQAPAVGEFAGGYLLNPVGSGTLVVIEFGETRVLAVGDLINWGPVAALTIGIIGGTAVNSIDLRDPRQKGAAELRTFREVASQVRPVYRFAGGADSLGHPIVKPGIVLPPGTAFGSQCSLNQHHRSSWIWSERAFEQSEEG